jgi:hypothetical protein
MNRTVRRTIFLTFLAAALAAPGLAAALPGVLADEAAITRDLRGGSAAQVAHRTGARNKHHAAKRGHRYDWTYYPYWRPYQYRYWQFYYPYGGPLF